MFKCPMWCLCCSLETLGWEGLRSWGHPWVFMALDIRPLVQASFPPPRYLMKFLAQLAEEQEVNKMTPSNIAIVLGPNLLWPPEKDG